MVGNRRSLAPVKYLLPRRQHRVRCRHTASRVCAGPPSAGPPSAGPPGAGRVARLSSRTPRAPVTAPESSGAAPTPARCRRGCGRGYGRGYGRGGRFRRVARPAGAPGCSRWWSPHHHRCARGSRCPPCRRPRVDRASRRHALGHRRGQRGKGRSQAGGGQAGCAVGQPAATTRRASRAPLAGLGTRPVARRQTDRSDGAGG